MLLRGFSHGQLAGSCPGQLQISHYPGRYHAVLPRGAIYSELEGPQAIYG